MIEIEKILGCGSLHLWNFTGIIYSNKQEIKEQKKSYFWAKNLDYNPITEIFSLDSEEEHKSASSKIVGRILEGHSLRRPFYGIQIYGKDLSNECDKPLPIMEVSGEIFFNEQKSKLIFNGTSSDKGGNQFIWNLESRSLQGHI